MFARSKMVMIRVLNVMTGGIHRDGITNTQLEYMRCIDKSDLQIDILDVGNGDESDKKQFEAYECKVIEMPKRTKKPILYIIALYKLVKRNNYHAIHVHGSSSLLCIELLVAKKVGIPIRIAHARNTVSLHKKLDKLLRPLFYSSYTHALACGKAAGQFLFPNRKFIVFHNGKDLKKFSFSLEMRNKKRAKFNFKNEIVLGFVGTLNHQKNPFFLVDILSAALQSDMKVKLLIIGDGVLRKDMEDYAIRKNVYDKIIFTGRISNVNEVIQATDIMLLPSLYEGLPNVVLEWQISGLPILLSDRITKECAVTDLLKYLPIDSGAKIWVSAIQSVDLKIDRRKKSEEACIAMKQAGFEIYSSAEKLKKLYVDGII